MLLKVLALQTEIAWEEKQENFSRIRKQLNSFVDEDLILLPETFATGFSMNPQNLEEPQMGETESFLQEISKEKNTLIGGSWIEKNLEGNPFNTFSIFSAEKNICRYRKIHPFSFAGEDRFYSSGNKIQVFFHKGFSICPFVCYDLRFPELFRKVIGKVDLFVIAANWPSTRIYAWLSLLKARAIENMAYVIGVNRVGTAGRKEKIYHNGYTAFFSPWGEEKILTSEKPDFLRVILSKEKLNKFRDKFPYIQDIRKELYEVDNLVNFIENVT